MESQEEGKELLESFMENNASNYFMYIEYSYKELGKTDAWLEKQKRDIGNLVAVKRELLLEWAYSSDDSLFEEELMNQVSRYAKSGSYNTIEFTVKGKKYYMEMMKYMHGMREKNWIVSIDMSGGLGRDNTAITVIDPANLEPVMIFKNNLISGTDLVILIKELVSLYLPKAVIVPERNYSGIMLIDSLINEGLLNNMYYTTKIQEAERTVSSSAGSIFNEIPKNGKGKVKKEKRVYGMNTTTKTRDIMLNEILYMIVNEKPYLVNNKPLFDEIKSLQMIKGRIDHPDGGHDDLLFSYLIGLYVLLYGKNINKFVKVKYSEEEMNSEYTKEELETIKENKRKETRVIRNIGSMVTDRNDNIPNPVPGYYNNKIKSPSKSSSFRSLIKGN